MKTQVWRPDTCGCKIRQVFDDDGNMTMHFDKKCPDHTGSKCTDVLEDNRSKNFMVAATKDLHGIEDVTTIGFKRLGHGNYRPIVEGKEFTADELSAINYRMVENKKLVRDKVIRNG